MANHAARPRALFLLFAASALGAALTATSCGDDLPSDTVSSSSGSSSGSGSSSSSSGVGGSGGTGGGGGAPDCYMNPMTHVEIINACTDAERVDKTPDLPLLGADGGLPPLP